MADIDASPRGAVVPNADAKNRSYGVRPRPEIAWALGLVMALVMVGCASTRDRATVMLATPTPALLACRVRLHVEHGVGKSKIEAFDREDLKPGVCVKREGQELAIPDDIALTSASLERYYTARPIDNWSAICQKSDQEDGQVVLSGRTQKYCIWNHAYRAKYPFDLRLEIEEPAPAKLKDYISLVRVFENGRLAFTWNQGSEARSISIPYEMLKDTGLPFDAALELRVMPAGVPIDDAVLREPAKEGADRTRQVLRIFGQAALNEIVLADPKLKAAYECYRWQLREIAQKVQAITGGSKPAAGVPPSHPPPKPHDKTCENPNHPALRSRASLTLTDISKDRVNSATS